MAVEGHSVPAKFETGNNRLLYFNRIYAPPNNRIPKEMRSKRFVHPEKDRQKRSVMISGIQFAKTDKVFSCRRVVKLIKEFR